MTRARYKYKKLRGLCLTPFCRNPSATQKNYCHKCRYRVFAKNNPIAYAYTTLRGNAKRRGKLFTISLQEFTIFCKENDYIRLKGQKKDSLTIDCKDPRLGYQAGNLQALTLSENSRKGNRIDDLPF